MIEIKNRDLAFTVLDALQKMGVQHIVVCAGARNTMLIEALDFFNFQVESYFEERSAAFYCVGLIQNTKRPVALLTTSGTAVAEALPAVIEAYYQALPLVVVTADRPQSYRGTGAPQSIIQSDMFRHYVGGAVDWSVADAVKSDGVFTQPVKPASAVEPKINKSIVPAEYLLNFDLSKPFHINVCFDEPLFDADLSKGQSFLAAAQVKAHDCFENRWPKEVKHQAIQSTETEASQNVTARPNLAKPTDIDVSLEKLETHIFENTIAIVSHIDEKYQSKVKHFLLEHKIPHHAEALSGLKNQSDLIHLQLPDLEGFDQLDKKYEVKNLLRIGAVPTHRLWRDLESKYQNITVYSFSDKPFTGLSRASCVVAMEHLASAEESVPESAVKMTDKPNEAYRLKKLSIQNSDSFVNRLRERQIFLTEKKNKLLEKFSESEPAIFEKLSQVVKDEALYLGNSLPIREWDAYSSHAQSNQPVYANRGANGIDGQISTYIGWAKNLKVSWCVLGDLTTLYDLAALGLATTQSGPRYNIIVINNHGGQIFSRVIKNKSKVQLYTNPQNVDFSAWAKMWGWDYRKCNDTNKLSMVLKEDQGHLFKDVQWLHRIIEIRVNNDQTQQFLTDWAQVCKSE